MRRSLVRLCADLLKAKLAANSHLPEETRNELAVEAILRVAAARLPAIAAQLEDTRPAHVNELLLPQLRVRARSILEQVAREASSSSGGDVTPELLIGRASYVWLRAWRDEAIWRLSRTGMTTRELGVLFGRDQRNVTHAVRRQDARRTNESQAARKAAQ